MEENNFWKGTLSKINWARLLEVNYVTEHISSIYIKNKHQYVEKYALAVGFAWNIRFV